MAKKNEVAFLTCGWIEGLFESGIFLNFRRRSEHHHRVSSNCARTSKQKSSKAVVVGDEFTRDSENWGVRVCVWGGARLTIFYMFMGKEILRQSLFADVSNFA